MRAVVRRKATVTSFVLVCSSSSPLPLPVTHISIFFFFFTSRRGHVSAHPIPSSAALFASPPLVVPSVEELGSRSDLRESSCALDCLDARAFLESIIALLKSDFNLPIESAIDHVNQKQNDPPDILSLYSFHFLCLGLLRSIKRQLFGNTELMSY